MIVLWYLNHAFLHLEKAHTSLLARVERKEGDEDYC
jgi:hypothetical protein